MIRPRLLAMLPAIAFAVACSDNGGTLAPAQGQVALHLTDAPFTLDSVRSLDVFVVRIDGRLAASTDAEASADVDAPAATDAGWVTLAAPNAAFNLMDLQAGASVPIGGATVDAGAYQSVRLILDTQQSSVTLLDGTVLSGSSQPSILFPSAGQTGIKVQLSSPIQVNAAAQTDVLIDFDAEQSFVLRGTTILQNGLLFKPVIRASIMP